MSQLLIEGVRPTQRFTKAPNELIQDADLSGLAIAVATFILSVPEKQNDGRPWDICLKALYRRFKKDSQYKIRLAVTELQDAGLLTIQYIRDQTGRRFADRGWLFHLDRIIKSFALSAEDQHEGKQSDRNSAPNKKHSNETNLNKTDSAPDEPQGQTSEPISLDLDESVIEEPTPKKPINPLLAKFQAMVKRSAEDPTVGPALAKKQKEDAAFDALQKREAELRSKATAALTAPYLNLSPQETIKALCSEYLAPNPQPDLDRSNRDRLSAWLTDGGDLLKMIDAFKAAKIAGTCTAKYTFKQLCIN